MAKRWEYSNVVAEMAEAEAEEEESDNEENDGETVGIEDQIEEMNLLLPPASIQDVVVNSPFAEAATSSADISTATAIIDTNLPSFSSY